MPARLIRPICTFADELGASVGRNTGDRLNFDARARQHSNSRGRDLLAGHQGGGRRHMGFDVAFGPADPVPYIQFGSAWLRP
jgi:hypothetical protein